MTTEREAREALSTLEGVVSRAERQENYKAVADSLDSLLRAVMEAMGCRPDQDPVIFARELRERLSVPPTDDERDLAQALFRTLYDAGVSFQSGDLIPRLTATVRAAGFRRQGPITDWTVAAATIAALDATQPTWRATGEAPSADDLAFVRAALEAAERAGSAVPCVECSGTGWLATYQRDGSATADSCRDCGGSGLRAAAPVPAGPWEPIPSATEQEKP